MRSGTQPRLNILANPAGGFILWTMKRAGDHRVNKDPLFCIITPLLGAMLGLSLGASLFAADEGDKGITVKLREVSVFGSGKDDFLRGQRCPCQDKPFSEVKHYPEFTSKVPIFGLVRVDRQPDDTNAGALYYFAVDESRGTGKGYDRFYFDANRDLDLRNDTVGKLRRLSATRFADAPG
jgi:hypothetical protein